MLPPRGGRLYAAVWNSGGEEGIVFWFVTMLVSGATLIVIGFEFQSEKGKCKSGAEVKEEMLTQVVRMPNRFHTWMDMFPFPRCEPTTLTHSGDIIPYSLCQPHWGELQASSTQRFVYPPILCLYTHTLQKSPLLFSNVHNMVQPHM